MRTSLMFSFLLALSCATGPASAAELARGKALYESNCSGCHSESVHGRTNRVAKSFEEIVAWVARWNATLERKWSADEIDDVSAYLNATYYRYACPPTVCKVRSMVSSEKSPG